LRAAAGAFGVRKEAVVDENVAFDFTDAGGGDLFGQLMDAGKRVLRGETRVVGPVGVDVISVLKGDLAFFGCAAAKGQIAAGDQD